MHLFKLAETYALAVDQYDANFRNTVLNQPVMENAIPFKEVAEMTIQHLNQIDPEGANPATKSATNALMDIINNHEVPTAQQLLSASNNAYSLVSKTAPSNKDALNTAKYLANLAKIIAYKFYQGNAQKEQSEQTQSDEPWTMQTAYFTKQEPLWKFLSRAYKTIQSGKSLAPTDMQRWQSSLPTITNRLSALNQMKTRTPAQEQERNVIALLRKRLSQLV
jgi:translation initiation factor 2B subunit (eIF-2B alpha/beta/delta family)